MPPLLELVDVRVDHGETTALHGLSLRVERGGNYALAGPNGSGKSTLIGVLAGVQPLTLGRVTRAAELSVALVVQRSAVPDRLPITVRETVAMARWSGRRPWGRATRDDRDAVAESLGALALDDLQHRPLASLSGGQRQRALVAQGLARRADLLLLDEPTVGLDERAHELIAEAIERELERGATVVHATHDPAVVAAARTVVRLEAATA